jgi:hypothetical protein
MNEQHERALMAGLKALANRTRNASASPHVEGAVLAEMIRLRKANRISSGFVAVAAALMVSVGLSLWSAKRDGGSPNPSFVRPADFVEIPGAAALPLMESGSIVRVSLPPSELPHYGVAIVPEMTVALVEAELLVAQDGQPRAIRLVNGSSMQRNSP